MTTEEVAKKLGCSRQTVYACLRRAGRWPMQRIVGGHVVNDFTPGQIRLLRRYIGQRQPKRIPWRTRFWKYVVKRDVGCWEWRGAKGNNGRAVFGRDLDSGSGTSAARASWEIHNGKILSGKHVLHSCDNPACVRPDHLYLGTHGQNMLRCHRLGRFAQQKPPGTF